jgi:thioesterase domain-containing protein
MAADYVALIRRIQPAGPYLLGGWSFGGQVAVEVARRLISAGEEVALLAIIDQSPMVPKRREDFDEAALIRDVMPPAFPLSAADLRRLGPVDVQLRHLVEIGHREGILPPGFGLTEARNVLKMLQTHLRAGSEYRARPYPGPITLLRAEDQHELMRDEPTLGWTRYARGGLEVIAVPGTHQTLMREPQVQTTAARLAECLAKVRAGLGPAPPEPTPPQVLPRSDASPR